MTIGRVALCSATLFFLLSGCSSVGLFSSYRETGERFAAAHGFEKRMYQAGRFEITSFSKIFAPSDQLVIYIEGDGAPWPAIDLPPADPTPHRLVVLALAAQDPRRAVVYLARPCQFLDPKRLEQCSPMYWTDRRYSEEVVTAMDNAIDQVIRAHGASRIELVGYSGGGTIALYLTQRRTDVVKLITIASPLDHQAWTVYHGLSPLTGPNELPGQERTFRAIPQYHFFGEKDSVVPASLAKGTLAPSAKILVIPGYDHVCCWSRDWERLLAGTAISNINK